MPTNLKAVLTKRVGARLRPLAVGSPRRSWALHVAASLASPNRRKLSISGLHQLRLLRRGFLPLSHQLYEFDSNDPADYLSDRQREQTQRINGPAAVVLDDKIAFSFLLERFGVPTPEVEAVVIGGELQSLTGGPDGMPWLRERLAPGERLVFKPGHGGGGAGVLLLEGTSGEPLVNGEGTTWEDLAARIASLEDYVVTTFVRQATYAAEIHAPSTNTLRMLTIVDRGAPPFIAAAVHRFGSARSAPADNWTQGGVVAGIDVDTGRLGLAATFPRDGDFARVEHHPETGAPIAGITLPHWDAVRDGILSLASRMRYLPYVGWDVVITADGYTVLEGNTYTGVETLQVHTPLLRDPRVREFYRRRGIVA